MADKVIRGQKKPLKWIKSEQDHEDPRRVRLTLTPKGSTVINEITNLME